MIAVPESVLAYFQQRAVQTAVDLLISGKEPKVPGNLRWADVSSFYHACLTSRQVPAEFAIFLEETWHSIWYQIPPHWAPCTPSNPARPDLAIGIAAVWDEGCFSRRSERLDCALELTVCLGFEKGVQLGVLLYDGEENVLLKANLLRGWTQEGDFDTCWTHEQIVPLTPTISSEPFERWIAQAWQAVDSAMKRV